ncbi:unnamed protein product [Camellia sinensis]
MPVHSSPIDKVAANDDILTQILIKLPVKSLMRFKSVSKHWLSLIVNPHFARCRNPNSSFVSGLFLYSSKRRRNPELNFIPLQNNENPSDDGDDVYLAPLTTIPSLSGKEIFSSCHGLLCCSSYSNLEGDYQLRYHILNPTTKQFMSLPQPRDGHKGFNLVFDPSRSPHYRVVGVWRVDCDDLVLSVDSDQNKLYYQIEIYSSETGSWRACAEPFTANRNSQFHSGVYWNGAINWFNTFGDSLYFNMEDERVRTIPMPPIPHGDWKGRPFGYYGESNDHLHFVEIYNPRIQFDVYEIERDYSGCFVKYHVDLGSVGAAFPQMMQRLSWNPMYYSFAILSLVREKKDDDSFMVLHIPGKILRYNLGDKSFEKICDVGAEHCDDAGIGGALTISGSQDHLHLIEMYHPPSTLFNVYESERDRSKWFVKYRIDLGSVVDEFPQMIPNRIIPKHLNFYIFLLYGEKQQMGSRHSL